ncbi:MAG: protease HtpX [Candidatus Dojkabacteria bacterium]|nr:MAG: protease HtpX [Candidatus Dojkabacteria bacterium]
MYSQIDKNKRLSFILMVVFIVYIVTSVMLLSYALTQSWSVGIFYGLLSLAISLIGTLSTYYFGDEMVLKMTGAIDVTDNPEFKYLNDRVEIIAIKAGIPKPRVHILPEDALNAYATGRDPKHSHIAITLGLLQKLNTEELDGVIAHEIAHIRNYDIRLMLIVSVLAGVLTYATDAILRGTLHNNKNRRNEGANIVMVIIALLLLILAPIISLMIQMAISRRREFLADMSAVEITRYPQGLISALKKLAADDTPVIHATEGNAHMFIDFPLKESGSFLRKMFSTHPPIEERIATLERVITA